MHYSRGPRPAMDARYQRAFHSWQGVLLILFFFLIPHCAACCVNGKESACQCRRRSFDPWVWKIPGGGNGNPFQYSCLENPMNKGASWAVVHRVAKSQTCLNDKTCTHTQHAGFWFPDQGWNASPLQWKLGVLSTAPRGKSWAVLLYTSPVL